MQQPADEDRRAFLIRFFNTGAWASAATAGLLGPIVEVMAAIPKALKNGRSIYSYKGDVWVDGDKLSPKNMQTMIISSRSKVVTGYASRVIFAAHKDAHFLRAESTLQLGQKGSSARPIHLQSRSIHLQKGRLLSVFARRTRADQFQLTTPTAVIGIRGTGLYAEVEPSRSYLCTCYGEVDIVAAADPSTRETIITKHHENPRYVYANNTEGSLIRPAPFKNHTDEELQLIEAIVGRTTPFSWVKETYTRPRQDY
ncbi:MAG: FecR domain-containing protein [Pseudomonadales bacterium]|nr:FecR domain-containing protein [Pseudomonadales bacterium]